jgi:hypothetical protein
MTKASNWMPDSQGEGLPVDETRKTRTMNRNTDTKGTRSPQDGELGSVLEHAQQLSESGSEPARTDWSYPAAHVGDLAVLALAFRG